MLLPRYASRCRLSLILVYLAGGERGKRLATGEGEGEGEGEAKGFKYE